MYKKRMKKWNIRKRSYRTASSPASTAIASPSEVVESPVEERVLPIPRLPIQEQTSNDLTLALTQPSQPAQYAGLELVLGSVLSWSQSKLDAPLTTSDPMSRYLASPEEPPLHDSRTMYRTFELVFDLWGRGMGDLAGLAARKGFYALEYVLSVDHPDLIWHVLDTVYDMVDRGHIQLLGLFVQHASTLAHRKLPLGHPLMRILQQLRACDIQSEEGRQYICHVLRTAWLRNVDMLSAEIETIKPQHLWLYEQLIWDGRTRLRCQSALSTARAAMSTALNELATNNLHRDASDRLRIEALTVEYTQMDLCDGPEAERLVQELLRGTQDGGTRSGARFHAYARKMLARLYEERQNWVGAEENMRWAVAKREAAHGTGNCLRVVRDMWVLSALLERRGKVEDASRVATDAVQRAEWYLRDVPNEVAAD